VFEAIPASAEVRAALEGGGSAAEVEAAARDTGLISIRERALDLVRTGVTTFDEFARLRL
jgi:type II secretory ATPase GspE/PulE/Tfp pilus assembly ATPase PilB-like protein